MEAQHKYFHDDSLSMARQTKLSTANDSLRFLIASKDSLIDSLTYRLNENIAKKEKERAKATALASKKSTMTKEQEYEKKSLFIYNFTKYIEWPIEYNGTEFVIGVAGDDQGVNELKTFMFQKKVSGKKIIVEKYKKGARYNLVYITSAESSEIPVIKNDVRKNKTLVVSDDASSSSHIYFILDQEKVKYMVDKPSIGKSGLKVGEELMRFSENKSSF